MKAEDDNQEGGKLLSSLLNNWMTHCTFILTCEYKLYCTFDNFPFMLNVFKVLKAEDDNQEGDK